jgi:hypothetical protein
MSTILKKFQTKIRVLNFPKDRIRIRGLNDSCVYRWNLKNDHSEQLIPEPGSSVQHIDLDPQALYMAVVNNKVQWASSQCWGSVTFWYGSGSADPKLLLMDSDPATDPAIVVSDLQDGKYLNHFSKIKNHKEVPKRRTEGFSYYFCWMIEGSGAGSVPRTNGSGFGRPKTSGSPTLLLTDIEEVTICRCFDTSLMLFSLANTRLLDLK